MWLVQGSAAKFCTGPVEQVHETYGARLEEARGCLQYPQPLPSTSLRGAVEYLIELSSLWSTETITQECLDFLRGKDDSSKTSLSERSIKL